MASYYNDSYYNPDLPTYQWPSQIDSLAEWFWDPITPTVGAMVDLLEGSTSTPSHPVTYNLGNATVQTNTIDTSSILAGWLGHLDQNIAQWGDWFTEDPRPALNTYFEQFSGDPSNPYYDIDSTLGERSFLVNQMTSGVSREALSQHLFSLGFSHEDIAEVSEGLYNRRVISPNDPYAPASVKASGQDWIAPHMADPLAVNDPTWSALARVFADAGLPTGFALQNQPWNGNTVAGITDANLLAALQAAGITPGDLPVTPTPTGTSPVLPATFSSQEAALASNNGTGGVSPTALNPGASFMYDLFGRHLKGFDTNGNPVFEDSATPGIFGATQKQQIADFLSPLPLSDAEKYGRTLLSQANLQPGLDRAMGTYDNTVLPGLTNLAKTGGRTATPDLYGADQYAYVRNLMGKPLYGAQAKSLLNEFMTKGVPQATRDAAFNDFNLHGAQDIRSQYAGQTGSFSSDFLGALARGNADITNQLARESADYQFKGLGVSNMMDASQRDADTQSLGLLNEMTRGQGSVESALNEAAMMRRAQALPLLGSTGVARAQLPLTFGQDIINAGGANRLTDESLRPGGRNLSIFNSLLTGAAPGNLGFVAQGQLPSATTSWLTGQAGNSAAFGNSSGGGFWNGVGSALLGNPNFTGLATKGLGALWDLGKGIFDDIFDGGDSSTATQSREYRY